MGSHWIVLKKIGRDNIFTLERSLGVEGSRVDVRGLVEGRNRGDFQESGASGEGEKWMVLENIGR